MADTWRPFVFFVDRLEDTPFQSVESASSVDPFLWGQEGQATAPQTDPRRARHPINVVIGELAGD